MLNQVSAATWSQLSEYVAGNMGLHFPPERWEELKRGLAGAAQDSGFEDAAKYVDWTLSVPPSTEQIQVLASHLTIGETYFFRDQKTLDALAQTILPELIHSRRGRDQRLRIWSSACSSGEEPYTLAILLHQLLPDLQDWQVSITATDINPHFLRKATTGHYGEWSFRNAPAWLKQRYFKRTAEGLYAIIPEIRKLVTFAHLNLVEDNYPSPAAKTSAMDIIFCRNVLMYFTRSQADKVIVPSEPLAGRRRMVGDEPQRNLEIPVSPVRQRQLSRCDPVPEKQCAAAHRSNSHERHSSAGTWRDHEFVATHRTGDAG